MATISLETSGICLRSYKLEVIIADILLSVSWPFVFGDNMGPLSYYIVYLRDKYFIDYYIH